MTYAAALIAGVAAFWLALSPAPFSPEELAIGAAAVIAVAAACWRLGLLDREGAPYLRTPFMTVLLVSRAAPSLGANLRLAGLLSGGGAGAYPALVRLKLRAESDSARAALGGALALEPGLVAVDCAENSMLVHALVEDDADETDLRALERSAAAAAGERLHMIAAAAIVILVLALTAWLARAVIGPTLHDRLLGLQGALFTACLLSAAFAALAERADWLDIGLALLFADIVFAVAALKLFRQRSLQAALTTDKRA